jgi:hypothetical protein
LTWAFRFGKAFRKDVTEFADRSNNILGQNHRAQPQLMIHLVKGSIGHLRQPLLILGRQALHVVTPDKGVDGID